jgi:hypothetical protein
MCTDRQTVKISPEKIREAAWKLWSDVTDDILRENAPIESFDRTIKQLIKHLLGGIVDLK